MYLALGLSFLASTTPVNGEVKSKNSIPSQELLLAKSNRAAPALPAAPLPEQIPSVVTRVMHLISTRMTEFSVKTAHIILILKHMLLEPLKFRSNYVRADAYLPLALQ
ncbi:hypothetical protein [Paenibacillus faecalis]|uniref:hypothetical protein n=1 Tax=Paenibacillus faecalis TaxID=2079532 RepID=UPI000D1056C5|nr:hypothetical protein [Paenibacillus faecalis]